MKPLMAFGCQGLSASGCGKASAQENAVVEHLFLRRGHSQPPLGHLHQLAARRLFHNFGAVPIMTKKALLQGAPIQDRIAYQGITFDDVLLEPAYTDVVPSDVDGPNHLTASSPTDL